MRRSSDDARPRCARTGFPTSIAERGSHLLGFAYASPFRLRPAYRYTVEDSVYVHPDTVREGIGRRLLEAVIAGCEAAGRRRLVAVIGGADERSISFPPPLRLRGRGPDRGRRLEARPLARPRHHAARAWSFDLVAAGRRMRTFRVGTW